VLVLPWLVWKVGYYGSLLPNTFVAKSGSGLPGQVLFAFVYLATFFVGYGYFLLIGRFRRQRRELLASSAVQQVGWVVPVWLLYIVAAGADFMEFRFMVPILPVLAMLGAVLVDRYVVPWRQVALIALLLLASYGHVALPSLGYPVHTLHDLNIWPTTSERALGSIGARLADAFPGGLDREDQVVMAFGSLGALPYGSQLPTIDMMGLADAHVAEHGEPLDAYYPGHLRIAPIDYLVERGVNLVATVRVDVEPDVEREHYRMSELLAVYPVVDLRELPPHATALEIPMDDHMSWLAIYLTPHPEVQRMIDRGGWQQYPIERVCDPDDVNPLVKIFGSATCD
jgi:arabinofuranosyltransferase